MGIGKNDFFKKLSQFLEICKMQVFIDKIFEMGGVKFNQQKRNNYNSRVSIVIFILKSSHVRVNLCLCFGFK
jgi:hypothetical protein